MLDRINFRDFGGGITREGHKIRMGILYRSGILQKLSEADQALIKSLNIQHIVDFRSNEEQERVPALLPGRSKVSLPCNIDKITRERLRPLLLRRHADDQILEVINGVYSEMVDLMVEPMGKLIRLILTPGALPVIIHCRAGKDRTGFAVAMIQWFLGLDRDAIMKEYLRSNDFLMPKISKAMKRLRLFTIGLFPKGNLQAAFEVKERYLQTAMEKVENVYGGIDSYLLQCGVSEVQLKELKIMLIESGR